MKLTTYDRDGRIILNLAEVLTISIDEHGTTVQYRDNLGHVQPFRPDTRPGYYTWIR